MHVIVAPMLVDKASRLHNIKDVFNGVVAKGDSVDEVAFYGRGAGKLPTASAVVSDILECVRLWDVKEPVLWEDGNHDEVIDYKKGSFSFYLRAKNKTDTKNNLTSLFGNAVLIKENDEEIIFITNHIIEEDFENSICKLKECGEEVYSTFRVLG